MEAKVKATGEIIEIVGEGIQNSNMVMSTHGEWFSKDELDIIPLSWKPFEPTYWQKLEHQYAGMAIQGLLSNYLFFKDVDNATSGKPQDLTASIAEQFTHALIEKLKESK